MTTVQLPQGSYRGLQKDGINVFHGIPYAAPFRRLQPPEKPSHADGEHDATSWGPVCPQLPSRLQVVMGPMPTDAGSHDEAKCGVLSVYAPGPEEGEPTKSRRLLPVIVFIHGGAFLTGSSQVAVYEGRRLARDAGAVIVTISYRLGVFGFLPPAEEENEGEGDRGRRHVVSPGTLDVAQAFGWVRENIAYFGGDPGNVTGAGQSAGAFHIQCLVDMFPEVLDRAILQSCPVGVSRADADRRRLVRKVALEHLPSGATLESATTEQLLHAQRKTCETLGGAIPPFCPHVAEGLYRTSDKAKSILICWTKEDGNVFARLEGKDVGRHGPALTQSLFSAPSRELGARWREQGHDVAFYEFAWSPEGAELGAAHCIDLPLFLGDEEAWKMAPMIGKVPWDEWDRRGKEARQCWGAFARNGTKPRGISVVLEPCRL